MQYQDLILELWHTLIFIGDDIQILRIFFAHGTVNIFTKEDIRILLIFSTLLTENIYIEVDILTPRI